MLPALISSGPSKSLLWRATGLARLHLCFEPLFFFLLNDAAIGLLAFSAYVLGC